MEGYILIVLQILIIGLIIWRRKLDSKEPLGCLAAEAHPAVSNTVYQY